MFKFKYLNKYLYIIQDVPKWRKKADNAMNYCKQRKKIFR